MKNFSQHPALIHAKDILDICSSLSKLNITYFGHACIDKDKRFSALCNHPYFFSHYLENQYYNADIHMVEEDVFGSYILWDALELTGKSEKMDQESMAFGIRHTFTLIDKNETGSHYYHFASDVNSNAINQTYLANIELLKLFIKYFNEQIQQSRVLKKAYQFKYGLTTQEKGFEIASDEEILIKESIGRDDFIKLLKAKDSLPKSSIMHFTAREKECIQLLMKGYSAKETAKLLKTSPRTVEFHLVNIKSKLNCRKKSQIFSEIYKQNVILF